MSKKDISTEVNMIGDGGEIINSVSIEQIINHRRVMLQKVTQAFELLAEAEEIARRGYGCSRLSLSDLDHRRHHYYQGFSKSKDAILEHVTRVNDKNIWSNLMEKSNMVTLMDAQAKESWLENLEGGNYPDPTLGESWSPILNNLRLVGRMKLAGGL